MSCRFAEIRRSGKNDLPVRTNACDPSKGFSYTPQTKANFGKINLMRGHRVIELVLKYYF